MRQETNLHNLVLWRPLTCLTVGLAMLGILCWTTWERAKGTAGTSHRALFPHPTLLLPVCGYLTFNIFPVIGALWPWGELQELLMAGAYAVYSWEKYRICATLGSR